MTRPTMLFLAAGFAFVPAVVAADEAAPPASANPDIAAGAEKLSQGFRLLLKGLMSESQQGWNDLAGWLGDLSAYEAPVRLPNGDILIRRKVPLPAGETDL